MLIDCFTFFRELDLLEGRLEYLYDSVDYFVIVEADITFAGKKKPLNFLNNIKRYKKYLDKIIYQPITIDTTLFHDNFNWQIEFAQRGHIDQVVKLFDNDAVVMISDLDEIPLKQLLPEFIQLLDNFESVALEQRTYYYNFGNYIPQQWYGTVLCKKTLMNRCTAQQLRDQRWQMANTENAGYHLSFWGSPEDIKTKIENFSHQEFNNSTYTDIEKISHRLQQGLDPFDRFVMIAANIDEVDSEFYEVFKKYTR